jgi:multidrug efflux pump subunit AcrB
MSGKMGMFMKVLPVMISVLLLSSLFEAFYFLPLHAKEFFSIGGATKTEDTSEAIWKRWNGSYQKVLKTLLGRKKKSLLLIVISIIVGTFGILQITKFQLFPEFDAQQVYLNGQVNINNKLADTEVYVTQIENALLEMLSKNEMDSVTSVIGFKFNKDQSFELGENLFQIFINLHEKAPENFFDRYINPIFSLEYDDTDMIRTRYSQDIAQEIQTRIAEKFKAQEVHGKKVYEEFNVYVQQAGIVSNDIEIGIEHPDRKTMVAAMEEIEAKLKRINGVEDIGNNANEGEKELKLRVNEYGQQLGLNEGYLISALKGSYLKAEYAKMFNTRGLVRVKVEDAYKEDSSVISDFKLTIPDGTKVVRLGDVCDFFYQKSFVKIFKEDGQKISSIFARVEKKIITPIEVMKALKPVLTQLQNKGVKIIVKGEEKENTKLKKEMSQAFLIALFLIFLTLVWMFNSLVLPLIILTVIPLSLFGALLGSKLMGVHLTMPGLMGVIGLAGVVVNDALIMLDFIKGSRSDEEIVHKATMRLRPILLTSVTTVLGLSSLIFFASGQALILQPMAISLGFGVAWATVLNLYYIPLVYAVLYRVQSKTE